jgi:DNA-binding transcriptional MerR regulator/ribosomal protein L32
LSSFFAPPLRQILAAWRSRPEAADDVLPQAEHWVGAAEDALRLLQPVVLWTEQVEEHFRQAGLDLKEIRRILADKMPDLPARAALLEDALHRYHGNILRIQEQELQRPSFSPILPFDQLIKVAFNLLAGKVDPLELQSRFGASHAYLGGLRHEAELRKALYPEVEWPEQLEEAFRRMEGGIGAVSQYLETGESSALEEGIQLLGAGSVDYAQALESLALSSKARFSKHDAIELWLRLQEHPLDLGAPAVTLFWQRLYQDADRFFAVVQRAQRSGFGIAEPETLRSAGQVHQQALDRLAALSAAPQPAEATATLLNESWDLIDYLGERINKRMQELQKSLEGAPKMRDLLDTLGQTHSGVLPNWVLRADLEQRLDEQKRSVQAMEAAPGASEETLQLLRSHELAYQRLMLYCEDDQVEHLSEGWKLLALTVGPLVEFDRQARSAVAKSGLSGQKVTCVRCGQVQSPHKVCEACGAALPQTQLDNVRYEDIAGEAGPSRNAAEYLSELVSGLQLGGSSWEQVGQEIGEQLQAVDKTRERFEKELLNLMGKNETLDVYSQFFAVRLGQLTQSLLSLAEAVQARNSMLLQGALGAYRDLHDELNAFQGKIAEGLGKK